MKNKNKVNNLIKENKILKIFVFLFSVLTITLSVWSTSLIIDNDEMDSGIKAYSKMNGALKSENARILKIREVEHEKTKELLSSLKGQLNNINSKLKFYSSSSKAHNKEQLDLKK